MGKIIISFTDTFDGRLRSANNSSVYGREVASPIELDTADVKTTAIALGPKVKVVTLQSIPGSGAVYYSLTGVAPGPNTRRVLNDGGVVDYDAYYIDNGVPVKTFTNISIEAV